LGGLWLKVRWKNVLLFFTILFFLYGTIFYFVDEPNIDFKPIGFVSYELKGAVIDKSLIEEARNNSNVKALFTVKPNDFDKVKRQIKENDGYVENSFESGVIVADIPSESLEVIAQSEFIVKASPERKYFTMVEESKPLIGFSKNIENNFSGKGIKVAILDTGISNHPILRNKIIDSIDFTLENNPIDKNGHGTMMAGIIAGSKSDNGEGFNGISPNIQLYNVKVLNDEGNGVTSDIIAGINYAIEKKVDIISMSFGGTYIENKDSPLLMAIQSAIDRGIKVIISAGNCGPFNNNPKCGGFVGVTTPGNMENAITVGAVDKLGNYADFSGGYESDYIKPDVVAPGVDIITSNVNGYVQKSGTSLSTAFVTGMTALVLEKKSLDHYQVKDLFKNTAQEKGDLIKFGSGLLNIHDVFRGKIKSNINKILKDSKLELTYYGLQEVEVTLLLGSNILDQFILSPFESKIFDDFEGIGNLTINSVNNFKIPIAIYDDYDFPIIKNVNFEKYLIVGEVNKVSFDTDYDSRIEIVMPNKKVVTENSNSIIFNETIIPGDYEIILNSKNKDIVNTESFNFEVLEMFPFQNLNADKTGRLWYDDGFYFTTKLNSRSHLCQSFTFFNDTVNSCSVNILEKFITNNVSFDLETTCSIKNDEIKVCFYGSDEIYKSEELQVSGKLSFGFNYCLKDESSCDKLDGWYDNFGKVCSNSRKFSLLKNYKDFELDTNSCSCIETYNKTVKYTELNEVCEYNQSERISTNYIIGDATFGGILNPITSILTNTFYKMTRAASGIKVSLFWDYDGTTRHITDFIYNKGAPYKLGQNLNIEKYLTTENIPEDWCDKSIKLGAIQYDYIPDVKCTNDCNGDYYHKDAKGYQKAVGFDRIYTCDYDPDAECPTPKQALAKVCRDNDVYRKFILNCEKEDFVLIEECGEKVCEVGQCITNEFCEPKTSDPYCNGNSIYVKNIDYRCNEVEYPQETCKDNNICQNGACVPFKAVLSSPRCTNNVESNRCVSSGGIIGVNNNNHIGDIKFTCFDYWNDNSQSGIFLGGWNWDSCQGDCDNCDENTNAESDFIIEDPEAGDRSVRVLVSDGLNYDQALVTFDLATSCKEGFIGTNFCSDEQNVQKVYRKIDCTTEIRTVQQCNPGSKCSNGVCLDISCNNNNDCSNSYFVDRPFCSGGDLYITSGSGVCNNPGTVSSSCSYDSSRTLLEKCEFGCVSGECIRQFGYSMKVDGNAKSDITIFKQPNDLLTLTIDSVDIQKISLDLPNDFMLLNGEYNDNKLSVVKGPNKFKLAIDQNAIGTYSIISGKYVFKIEIINDPSFIILTDSQALDQEFPFTAEVEVVDLIESAYKNAERNNGIVYDLYYEQIGERPWQSFNDYKEDYDYSYINNVYSLKVADFIKNKCKNSCDLGKLLIIGDDFVVPHYRRDVSLMKGINWPLLGRVSDASEIKTIYSDYPYIQQTSKAFKDTDELFVEQDIIFVVPDNPGNNLLEEINKLQDVIDDRYEDAGTISVLESSQVGCNSHSKLDEHTLVLVGTEKDNNAIACLPFVSKEKSSMSIQKNVWDTEHYALVLRSDDEIYDNILAMKNIITKGPNSSWDFSDSVVACLWDGKFEGAKHPTAEEITCNMIPVVELIVDARDSWKCKEYLPVNPFYLQIIDNDPVEGLICGITHAATAYDYATWGAAIATAGGTGLAGEVFDGSIATVKVFLKNNLPEMAKTIGTKAVKDAADTILSVPQLMIGSVKLIARSPGKLVEIVKGSISVFSKGAENSKAFFAYLGGADDDVIKNFAKTSKNFENGAEALNFLRKLGINIEGIPYNDLNDDFLISLGEMIRKIDIPEGSVKSIVFEDFPPKLRGTYNPTSKKITFPIKLAPSPKIIAHELSHAKSLTVLSQKLKKDPFLLSYVDGGEWGAIGLLEIAADITALNKFSEYGVDNYVKVAFEGRINKEGISTWSNNVYAHFFQRAIKIGESSLKAQRTAALVEGHYLAYARSLAKLGIDKGVNVANNKNILNLLDLEIAKASYYEEINQLSEVLYINSNIMKQETEQISTVFYKVIELSSVIESKVIANVS